MKESLFQEICFLFTFRSVYFYPKTIINYYTTPNTIPVAGCLHKLLAIAPLYKTSTAPHCVPHAGIFIYLSFSLVCVYMCVCECLRCTPQTFIRHFKRKSAGVPLERWKWYEWRNSFCWRREIFVTFVRLSYDNRESSPGNKQTIWQKRTGRVSAIDWKVKVSHSMLRVLAWALETYAVVSVRPTCG